jgi:arabinofuranosyltransferase
MSGRFLTLPCFCAALIVARAAIGPRTRLALGLGALALALTTPLSPLRAPLDYGRGLEKHAHIDDSGIADERGYWFDNVGLFSAVRGDASHPDVSKGFRLASRLREEGPVVSVANTLGYLGFWCGPSVHLVDPMGLADAFLARLPLVVDGAIVAPEKNRFRDRAWRIGHYVREIPEGYVESRSDPTVELADPELEALRRRIDRVAREPLFSVARLRALFGG